MQIKTTNRFEKDVGIAKKRGRPLKKLQDVISLLLEEKPLPARCRPHRLSGDWYPFMECHIEPDWLLIYRVDNDVLYLVRTGTHADLF